MTRTPTIGMILALLLFGSEQLQAQQSDTRMLTLTVGGDVMVGRYKKDKLRILGGEDHFEQIGPIFQKADVAMLNLETPIADHHPRRILKYGKRNRSSVILKMPTRFAKRLKQYGIDAVSLANNHIEDADRKGVETTVTKLEELGVEYAGAHPTQDPHVVKRLQRNGHWVALFAVTIFRNRGEPRKNQKVPVAYSPFKTVRSVYPKRIAEHRKQYPKDLIVVSIHWGGEGKHRYSSPQRRLARKLIEAGADLVWGHHPHVLQPVEAWKDGMILYSTGNLVFDMLGKPSRRSGLFTLQFEPKPDGGYQVTRLDVQALILQGRHAGTRLATPKEARTVFEPLTGRAARRTGMKFEQVDSRLIWTR